MSKRIEAIIDGPFRHGVITNMPRSEYDEACGLNPSSLKKRSPKHIKYAYENNGKQTDEMLEGTVVHTLVWEPHKFEESYAIWTGKVRNGNKWKQFQADNEGREIITEKMLRNATRVSEALCSDPLVKQLAAEGLAETAVFSSEAEMQVRGMIDWIATQFAFIVDLKRVASIDPRLFGTAFIRYGWDVSLACYREWFQREANKEIKGVKLITVESEPPYDVAVVNVDEAVLDQGLRKARDSIKRVRECIESGSWPGIANGKELPLHIPTWAMEDDTELEYAA